MPECSEHSLLHRLDEWRQSHMRVHELERRGVDAARETMERRLDGMNEFRSALQDAQARTVSRELFDLLVGRVASVERLLPIIALLSSAVGAVIAGVIVKVMEG